jgi:hypothetical protein
MGVTVQMRVNLEPVSCSSCGVLFGLPEEFYEQRVRDHKSWHCPNGHSQYFAAETEEEKLRKVIESDRTRIDYLRKEVDREQKAHSVTKGQLTKTKKRIANGVCPECHRNFTNVARHMATQHPDYAQP